MFFVTNDAFIYALIGLPGGTISLALLAAGIYLRSAGISILGALASMWLSYVAGAYAAQGMKVFLGIEFRLVNVWIIWLVLVGGNVLSAIAVLKRKNVLAAISIAPFIAAIIFMGVLRYAL